MTVFGIVAAVFFENLNIVLGLFATFVALFEYRRRRQAHLLWFAAHFLGMAVAFACIFAGQMAVAGGRGDLGPIIARAFWLVLTANAAVLLLALAGIVLKKFNLWFALLVAVLAAAMSARILAVPASFVSVGFASFPTLPMPELALAVGLRLLADGGFLLLGSWRRLAGSAVTRADHCLVAAGALGCAFNILAVAAVSGYGSWLMVLGLALYFCRSICLIFGSLTVNHQDSRLSSGPHLLVTSSLKRKSVVLVGIIFWILAFAGTALTSNYFALSARSLGDANIELSAQTLAQSYIVGVKTLKNEAHLIARYDNFLGNIAAGTADSASAVGVLQPGRTLHVFGPEGRLVFAAPAGQEKAYIEDQRGIAKALAGNESAYLGRIDGQDRLLVAVPWQVDGGRWVVLLSTDVALGVNIKDFLTVSSRSWSAAGLVSYRGEVAYGIGEPPIRETVNSIAERLATAPTAILTTARHHYVARRLGEAIVDGNDFVYVSYSERQMADTTIRIVGLVSVMVFLVTIILLCLMAFLVIFALKPLDQLRQAAKRVEEGRYDFRASEGSSDELGDLARAFNRMAKAVGQQTTQLQNTLEEEQEFLMHTVHEMRTPLNIFRWTTEMMRYGDTGRLSREQMELVEQLHQTTGRLLTMVQNMSDVAMLDRGQLPLKMDFAAIEDIVDEAAGQLAVKIREKNLILHWNRPEKPLPKVFCDRELVVQVLANLLSNAVKYTRIGGHVEIGLSERTDSGPGGQPGRYLEVSVEDNGRGIPTELHGRVFSRFFRAAEVVKDEIEGAGLGLFISRAIVERSGGRIWFESRTGAGATFRFTVPLDKKLTGPDSGSPAAK